MLYLSKSPNKTQKLAVFLLEKLSKQKQRKSSITIALEGELGAGKTTFVQGLAKALGIKAKIKSPTFNLIKKYSIKFMGLWAYGLTSLYHIDCYRLRDHRDLTVLGMGEILKNQENLVVIEWADRVKKILPRKHIRIHIDHIDENTRKIRISP